MPWCRPCSVSHTLSARAPIARQSSSVLRRKERVMKRATGWTRAFLGSGFVLLFIFTLVGHSGAQVCVEPPAGLVSWWPADGNADDIAGGNDATLMGGATFAPGKVGQAFFLDGIDAFV